MLVIRTQQIEVFRRDMLKRFEERVATHLRESFPEQCAELDATELRALIKDAIERARHYSITAEFDVWRFIDLMFFYGRYFDSEFPAASALLGNGSLSGGEKVDALYAELGATATPAPFHMPEEEEEEVESD